MIKVDNYAIRETVENILNLARLNINNGKLGSITHTSSGIKVTCPFHGDGRESTPSCFIREEDGVYHCFACGSSGPFYKFIAAAMDSSIEYAKKWLITNFGECIGELINLGEPIETHNSKQKYRAYTDNTILDRFQSWHPYLKERGVTRETATKFGVKYDPQHKCLVFPCYDIKGNLVMLHTRSVLSKFFHLDEDVPKPLFGLYNIVRDGIKTALITEGPFDAMKATQFGIPAFATLGMLSDSQIEQVNESGIEQLYIMFDNDPAGRGFTRELKSKLKKTIIVKEPQILVNKKDIGELTYEEFWESINNSSNSIKLPKRNVIIV